jgi:hypothetical protein
VDESCGDGDEEEAEAEAEEAADLGGGENRMMDP